MAKLAKVNNQYIVSGVDCLTQDTILELEHNPGTTVEVDVNIVDKRTISSQQRAFIFVLIKCYDDACGFIKKGQKYYDEFGQEEQSPSTGEKLRKLCMHAAGVRSLSNCSMTKANTVIELIIGMLIDYEIPFNEKVIKDDLFKLSQYHLKQLLFKGQCFITGKKGADVHLAHLDTVGMGNNRTEGIHIGKRVMNLLYKYHNEEHAMGTEAFLEYYKLQDMFVIVDEEVQAYILDRRKKGSFQEVVIGGK